jgi:signal transduction histidine kinase
LDLEKFETGRQKLIFKNNISKNNIHLDSVKQLIINKNIAVELICNETEIKHYDEERIIQVIHNLLSNAIKFCAKLMENKHFGN